MVFVLSCISAVLQMLGVSIITTLVSGMMDIGTIVNARLAYTIIRAIGVSEPRQIIAVIAIATVVLYLIKNAYGLLFVYINARYAHKIQREISLEVMRSYMQSPYDFFLKIGTAQALRDIQHDPIGVYQIVYYLFNVLTELLSIVLIIIYIAYMDYLLALVTVILALLCLALIFKVFRKRVKEAGIVSRSMQEETSAILIEAVEGIKDVQVKMKQPFFQRRFEKMNRIYEWAQIQMTMGSLSPAYMIEAFFVGGIMSVICWRAIGPGGIQHMLPTIGAFTAGAVRMLPSLGRISSSLNNIVFALPHLSAVYQNIQIVREKRGETFVITNAIEDACGTTKESVSFKERISIEGITWHYPDTSINVLNDISLSINKGESIGIIGKSGAGKTTLLDLILGLHTLQKGFIKMDGIDIRNIPKDWAQVIGYVPQNAYLSARSIKENVAFGEEKTDIDEERVGRVLSLAQLEDFIKTLEKGIETEIGERGIQLSGGQRQRIAIARALYHNPQILVLDEATSALDNETEASVMDAIEHLHGTITMIIVAHRLTTVEGCDRIYEIIDGRAVIRKGGASD